MKEIVVLTSTIGILFLLFATTLFMGFKKKNKRLKFASMFLFLAIVMMTIWTGIMVIDKSFRKIKTTLAPRTGMEIYVALFENPDVGCVEVLHAQDQIIPKIDYAIYLETKTCAEEIHRILSHQNYDTHWVAMPVRDTYSLGTTLEWFNPTLLGDSVLMYETSMDNNRNIQTIWTNKQFNKAFIRDILD